MFPYPLRGQAQKRRCDGENTRRVGVSTRFHRVRNVHFNKEAQRPRVRLAPSNETSTGVLRR